MQRVPHIRLVIIQSTHRCLRLPRLPMLILAVVCVSVCTPAASITLIQRSDGLENPEKEEGHTEYEVGDVNGDGHLDIVSVGDHGSPYINSSQHGIMTWLGDGAGHWAIHQVGNFGYGGVALGDLNRDGNLDAAWGIHHNDGSGGFGDRLLGAALGDGSGNVWIPWGDGLATTGEDWGMFATDLADFDLDGRLDLISQSFGGGNGIRLYRNLGDGTWDPALVLSGGSVWYTIETGDVNADGNPDFICSRSNGTVWIGDGEFGFTVNDAGIASGIVRAVGVGDIDRDGTDDIVVALGTSGVRAYRYDSMGQSWIDASNGLPTSGGVDLVQFGDLDGDGWLDVVTYADPTGRVYIGDGVGNWTADATWTMPSPGEASAMRVDGDIDHDGRDDIVIQATKSGFPFYRNQLRVYSPWVSPDVLTVRVIKPDGGETFVVGSIREVRWATAMPEADAPATITLRLSLGGENGPWTMIAEDLPDNGRYEWLVDAAETSTTCRIEVMATTSEGSAAARSTAAFSIAGGTATGIDDGAVMTPKIDSFMLHLAPNPVGRTATLRWDPVPDAVTTLSIYAADGRCVDHRVLDASETMNGSTRWSPAAELRPGIYFAVLDQDGRRIATRMVVLDATSG
jgi:hypothetical protein